MQQALKNTFFNLLNTGKDICYSTYYAFSPALPEHGYLFVSFPKTGRTWVRSFLAKYVELIYGIPFNIELQLPNNLPQISFSHIVYSTITAKKASVVVLLRNPLDTLVSYYHERSKRQKKNNFKRSLSNFIRSRWGVSRLVHFLNNIIRYTKNHPEVYFITYEDMHHDLTKEMTKLLSFLKIHLNHEALETSVEFCGFTNMQNLEKQGKFDNWRLQPFNNQNVDSFKVRKGKVGGYKEELTAQDIDYVNAYVSKYLNPEIKKRFLAK